MVEVITRAEFDRELAATLAGLPRLEHAALSRQASRPRLESSKKPPAPPAPKKPDRPKRPTRMTLAEARRFLVEAKAAIVVAESKARIATWSEHLRSL